MASEAQEELEKLLEEAGESYKVCMQPGLGLERTVQLYNETSAKYDKFVLAFGYRGYEKLAEEMTRLYPGIEERARVRVLDVGCGTGLVGQELHKAGFTDLDGLDPSPGMLEKAVEKGVYRRFFNDCVDDRQLAIEDDTYDAIVTCGALAENCIPCCAFNEMIRIVKPGGYVVNVACEEHVRESEMYRDLDAVMEGLEREGKWRKVKEEVFNDCLKDDRPGLVFVHQVL